MSDDKKMWWIMPKYNIFSYEEEMFGQSYIVEEQYYIYSKNRPPLKMNFKSKEAAERWLKEYLGQPTEEDKQHFLDK